MKWNEFYKLPLMIDEYGDNVIAQPGDMGYRWAFDWIENDIIGEYPIAQNKGGNIAKKIVAILNGEVKNDLEFTWSRSQKCPIEIEMDGMPCMCIRGYGELTGTGGFHLPMEEANKIQDDFRDWIINTLNNKNGK